MLHRIGLIIATLVWTAAPTTAEVVSNFKLDNGMEVVVLEDHRAPVVVHMVWYRVGAADEPAGRSGIAHFLEHLLFKGTDTIASGEFSEVVSANGGSDNAFTSWDYTAYYQRVASDRLELMMTMESDRMRNLRLSEADVLTERDVILEERSQRTDSDPGALFSEQRRAAQYLNHPYAVPIIGWRHEMEQLSLDDALEFYQTYYAPNNAILIVAGDVTPDEVRVLAEKYYSPLAPTENLPNRLRPQEPPQLAERRIALEDARIGQPYVMRTYLAPERDSGDQTEAAALEMLAELLGGSSTTSVLAKKLQFDTQKAIYTSAFYSGTSLDDTTFGLVVVPNEGLSLIDAETALDAAVAEFMVEGVDSAQLERIKMQLRAAQIYGDDDVSSLARRYGQALTSGLTIEDVQAWPDILQSVTEEDVMVAARMVFDRQRAVTGLLSRPTATEETTQ
ncbi:M16 family metallopeptidase [Pseudohalocynthiibacter aestuariivivens]|jgi:zinc protease|uniref:M16 family metallopeptidase n=1 Tax=Pseudohalocynthiibacter aestuariivivens TaxID=1591409 RepID=A0ABV5JDM5_9RHOB|nr:MULTISPECIES: pitrilysin family protein [Pseudohalocynthiibacter]MBS9717961.1 insulinase family protein [Pseudohalocynthiibacter aestuariivivens]MCK0103133.1 insulinase family protein [Pseudohalocynthiibacter sp. F2068]